MRRAEAVKRWGAIAGGGEIDADTRAWLANVARALLLANDEKDTNDKRTAVLRAVGLTAQGDDSLRLAIRQVVTEIPDTAQRRLVVRMLRNDLPQCRISDRAIDLQIKRALAVNSRP